MLRFFTCGLVVFSVSALGCSSSSSTPSAQLAGAGGSSSQAGSGASGSAGAPPSGGSSSSGANGMSGATGIGGSQAGSGGSAPGSAGAGLGGAAEAAGGGGAPGGMIIVSDNFDATPANGAPDASKWFPPPSGSTNGPTIVSSKSHSAPNSASSTGTSNGQGAALIPMSGLPTADNHFYVRAWINFAKATSAVTGHAAFLVAASSRDQSGTELRLGVSIPPGFATAMLDLNLQNPTDGPGEVTRFSNSYTTGGNPLNMPGTTFEADTWTCVEASFDGGHNEFRLWIGDTEVTNMHVTNFAARPTDPPRSTWAPSFKFLKIGAQNYSGDIGQVFYDDVIVGSQPIGCK